MNALDVIILVLVLFGFFKGFSKGFLVEVLSLFALVAGVYGAIYFSNTTGHYLERYLDWGARSISITSFTLLFIGIVWGVIIFARILTKTAKMLALGMLNRILGGLFGGVKWMILLSIGLFLFINLNLTFFMSEDYIKESTFSRPLMSMGKIFYNQIKEKKEDIQNNVKVL